MADRIQKVIDGGDRAGALGILRAIADDIRASEGYALGDDDNDVLDDLCDRLKAAAHALNLEAGKYPTRSLEWTRLKAKRAGVLLAMSYAKEMQDE